MNYLKVLIGAAAVVVMTTSANAHVNYRPDPGPVVMPPGPVGDTDGPIGFPRAPVGHPGGPVALSRGPIGDPAGKGLAAPFKWDGVLGPRVLQVTDLWKGSAYLPQA